MLNINNKDFNNFVYKEVERLKIAGSNDDKLLNNIMLLVSTGAFGLSINFFFNGIDQIKSPFILKISWICLAFSILFNALGYFLSRKQADNNISFLNKEISSQTILTPEKYNEQGNNSEHSFIYKAIWVINYISFIIFILGVLSLTIFAIIQLN